MTIDCVRAALGGAAPLILTGLDFAVPAAIVLAVLYLALLATFALTAVFSARKYRRRAAYQVLARLAPRSIRVLGLIRITLHDDLPTSEPAEKAPPPAPLAAPDASPSSEQASEPEVRRRDTDAPMPCLHCPVLTMRSQADMAALPCRSPGSAADEGASLQN